MVIQKGHDKNTSGVISTVTEPGEIDREAWSAFVSGHPDSNIFHTPEYFDFCNSVSGYSGVVVACFRESRIAGIIVAVIQRDFRPPFESVTARSIIWGGPLSENNDPAIADILIRSYNLKTRRSVLFTQFRNLTDLRYISDSFRRNGFVFEEHLNILFDLRKGAEALWSEIHPTRRKQINRSVRRNVKITVHSDPEPDKLERCYSLLKKVYSKARQPLPGQYYFQNAFRIFTGTDRLKLFLAELGEEIIGFRIVFCYNAAIYDWYAAASEEHLDKYPNDILPWRVILWGSENGFSRFDFGGAGKPGRYYGVRDYKIRFGGEVVNYGRFTRIHRPILYFLVMSLFRIRKAISGKG